MEVILLENIRNLGQFGTKVKVAKGFGRNFLIPQGKAVPATKENLAKFEARREELRKVADQKLAEAQSRVAEINAVKLVIQARAGDEGKLFGSVGTLEICNAYKNLGIDVKRQDIRLPNGPLRELGDFEIEIQLHAEISATAHVSVVPEAKE